MLYRKAEIMIFDEPTAVLTPQEIDFLLKIIDGLRRIGKTIILITHKIEEISRSPTGARFSTTDGWSIRLTYRTHPSRRWPT